MIFLKIFVLDKYRFGVLLLALFSISLFLVASLSPEATEEKLLPIYSVETKEKVLSITFDSAWTAEDIPLILDTLSKYNCKATFFVVGSWAEKYPECVKLIYDSGHEVAGHSYNHAHYNSLSEEDLIKDMAKCDEVIKNITGVNLPIFRAPYGEYNNTVVRAANASGRMLIQWDVDSLDWKDLDIDAMKKRILPKVQNGSVILFHNGTKHTASALPSILESLKNEGYSFKSVGDMILYDNFEIDHTGRQKELIR